MREKFGVRVRKISVDAGFTCPNRDGVKGTGGCSYCLNASFSPYSRTPLKPIEQQIEDGIAFYRKEYPDAKFIVYFQAYTNTYAPVEELRRAYEVAFKFPDVVGISIGTRPDCLSDAVCRLVSEFSKRRAVWVELGVETSHDSTLKAINRCETWNETVEGVNRIAGTGAHVIAHLIYGLPCESRDMMVETTRRVSALPFNGIKMHHLYIAKHTVMEQQYARGEIKVMTLEEWVELFCELIQHVRRDVVIHRYVGELRSNYLIAPKWDVSNSQVRQRLESAMRSAGVEQGGRLQ